MRTGADLVVGCIIAIGLPRVHADGVLGEYFAPLASSCSNTNGSLTALHGLLPAVSRKDSVINFPSRSSFDLKRCAWERISGSMVYNCRGSEEFRKYFGARWSGDLLVFLPGLYTFEIEADDGARLTMGYGRCPGILCGDRATLMNTQASELRSTNIGSHSAGKDCLQCGQGIYIDCFITSEGCEPFSVWRLEADGGSSGCGSPATTINGTRWLHGGTHPFELDYFQRGDSAKMILRYSGPDTGGTMIPVPSAQLLFPSGNTLRAEWFSLPSEPLMEQLPPANLRGAVPPGAQLVLREDDTFDTNGPGVGTFSTRVADFIGPLLIRWTGFLFLNNGGDYTFRLESDDGSRLVIAARGAGGERVLVDNDGLHAGVQSTSVTVAMLPGLHPIRIEYFHVPGQGFGVPRPPGVQIFFRGQDTQMNEQLIARDRLVLNDGVCKLHSNDWSLGMFMARDCGGRCFDGEERAVGDKVCDDGTATFLGTKLLLTCPAYDDDNNDCNRVPAPPANPVRPEYRCHVSCPAGNFSRRDCAQCSSAVEARNGYGSFCSESSTANLTYIRCCSAKLYGLEYWDQDCIAFGSTTRCNETLLDVLAVLRETEPRLDWLGARPDNAPLPNPTADLMVDCEGDYCNSVTPAFVLNPFTLQPTETRICPIQESSSEGTECYEGPWEVTYLSNPFTQCQGGRYRWNFCRDRKTLDGRPFVKCCSFAYLNALGQGECRFTGIAEGTCARYLEMLRRKNLGNNFFSISNPSVLKECADNLCNDPMDADFGCPAQVVENHPYTIRDRLQAGPAWENLIVGAPAAEINWPLIIIPICGVLFLCVSAYIYRRSLRTAPESPWHSQAAKVVGKNTFIEPERDLGGLEGTYGVVKPRPLALRQIMEADKIKPQALRLDPSDANPLVAAQAEVVALARGPIAASLPSPLQQAAQGDFGSPLPMRTLLENEEDRQDVEAEMQLSGAEVETLALTNAMQVRALETDAIAAQPSPYDTALVLQATPVGVQHQIEQVFLPPEELLPVATLAVTQSLPSTPGATPVIAPQITGVRGRPAAAARMQRQGVGGVPRVAT